MDKEFYTISFVEYIFCCLIFFFFLGNIANAKKRRYTLNLQLQAIFRISLAKLKFLFWNIKKKKISKYFYLFSYREYRVQRNVKIIFHNSKHEYKHFLKSWIINEIMILYDIEYKIKLSPRGILILFNYTWNSLRHCDNCIVRGN